MLAQKPYFRISAKRTVHSTHFFYSWFRRKCRTGTHVSLFWRSFLTPFSWNSLKFIRCWTMPRSLAVSFSQCSCFSCVSTRGDKDSTPATYFTYATQNTTRTSDQYMANGPRSSCSATIFDLRSRTEHVLLLFRIFDNFWEISSGSNREYINNVSGGSSCVFLTLVGTIILTFGKYILYNSFHGMCHVVSCTHICTASLPFINSSLCSSTNLQNRTKARHTKPRSHTPMLCPLSTYNHSQRSQWGHIYPSWDPLTGHDLILPVYTTQVWGQQHYVNTGTMELFYEQLRHSPFPFSTLHGFICLSTVLEHEILPRTIPRPPRLSRVSHVDTSYPLSATSEMVHRGIIYTL